MQGARKGIANVTAFTQLQHKGEFLWAKFPSVVLGFRLPVSACALTYEISDSRAYGPSS